MKPENVETLRAFLQEAYDRAKHAYAYSNNQNFRAFSDGEACLAMEALRLIDKLNNNECQN